LHHYLFELQMVHEFAQDQQRSGEVIALGDAFEAGRAAINY